MKKLYERAYIFFKKYPLMISIGYMCIYFPIFSLLEQFCEPRYVIHCALDDMIPFNEWFVIPYVVWFLFVPGMVLFFLRKSKEDYIKCCKVIYGGMSICLLIYYLFPNGLSLRQPLEDKNICCMIVNQLRSADTPANVCPSIHVSSTIGILFVLFNSEKLKKYRKLKATMLVLGTFICISTVVIDQHSVVDAVCGMMLSAVLFYLVLWHNNFRHLVRWLILWTTIFSGWIWLAKEFFKIIWHIGF